MWAKPSSWGRRVRWVPPSRRAGVLTLAGLVVLAGGGAALTTGLAAEPGSPAYPEVRGLARSAPVRIVIPTLGVDAPVVALALDRDGLPAPPGPAVAGWYGRGTSPGEPGSAVIVGHTRAGPAGPAVFAGLDRLVPGDPIRVWRADGTVARFTVAGFPVDQREPGPSLRLVPAGTGPDRRAEPVVFATLVP